MVDLHRSVAIYSEVKDRIAAAYKLDEDDPFLADTVEGETGLQDALVAALREAREAGAMADAIKGIIDANKARQERLKAKSDAIRKAVSWAMQEVGLKRLDAPDMTASLGAGRPKMAFDEDRLEAYYKTEIVSYKADRDRIQAAIDHGDVPTGVTISNAEPVLTVRVR